MKKIAVILILISAMVLYIIAENALALKVRREKLGSGVKIMQISDLHKRRFGKNNRRITDIAAQESPDLIFVTGDLVSRTTEDFTDAKELLTKLCETAPVYMVYGNHEQYFKGKKKSEYRKMVTEAGVKLLNNNGSIVNINGRELKIAGNIQPYSTYKKEGGYRDLDDFTLSDMKKTMGECPEGEILLLAHNPKWAEVYAEWGAKYTFSGHVHGGVVRLFGVGILSPERKFLPKYSKGVYDVGEMKLLVSAGLGKLRAFNAPEIVIYEI